MKKTTMRMTWGELLKNRELPLNPKGYSTLKEIAKKMNISEVRADKFLRKARLSGKIESVRGMTDSGNVAWFYKD